VRVGPYELGPKIGGGGMARVHLGHRVQRRTGVPDTVAIKLIRDELLEKREYEDMFLDEARILSRLEHPGIIRTYEFGAEDGLRYIAMELLLGRSLMDAWDACVAGGGRMPVELGVHVCARVARALEYAHELRDEDGRPLNLVHRDVNPTNVFLTYDGDVKLIDFGLAKAAGRVARSKEGIIKGKVPYLSPEQILEEGVDRRTDVYALGATLWECTTGRRLFKRDTDLETIRAIQRGDIPDPRTFGGPPYPDDLWDVVRKALARNRDERYATAADLACDLERFLERCGHGDRNPALATWLAGLFPGEATKQRRWLDRAERPDAPTTMFPPAPVAEAPPIVSARAPARADEDEEQEYARDQGVGDDGRTDSGEPPGPETEPRARRTAEYPAPDGSPAPRASAGLLAWLFFGMVAGGVLVAIWALAR
jgi:serine/threonine protein kinase